MHRPLSDARLAAWYLQLRHVLVAGLDLASAVEQCTGPPVAGRAWMSAALRSGSSVDAMLQTAPAWLPMDDRLLLSAGADAGQLPVILERLAAERSESAANRQRLRAAAIYPIGLLHLAAALWPLPGMLVSAMNAGPANTSYLRQAGLGLLTLWLCLALAWGMMRIWPGLREYIPGRLPGFRGYHRSRALARFASVLHILLESGSRYAEAVGGAALVSHDRRLRDQLLAVHSRIRSGESLGQQLSRLDALPMHFRQLFSSAEFSGQLHHALPTLARHYREEAQRQLVTCAFWYPKLLFLAIAAFAAITLLRVYSHYFQSILSMSS